MQRWPPVKSRLIVFDTIVNQRRDVALEIEHRDIQRMARDEVALLPELDVKGSS